MDKVLNYLEGTTQHAETSWEREQEMIFPKTGHEKTVRAEEFLEVEGAGPCLTASVITVESSIKEGKPKSGGGFES